MKTIAITGALGYSGSYMAQEALKRGHRVIGLTNSQGRDNPLNLPLYPLDWASEETLASHLQGCDVLINTYWIRFQYGELSHELAVKNTRVLFAAAKRAGVQRIVHVSITNPLEQDTLPYFRGKYELEQCLKEWGGEYSILRPAVLFGDSPGDDILINNMAWALRTFPAIGTFGWGDYKMQPIHVQDFAELALDEAESATGSRIIEAIGPEAWSFRDLFIMLRSSMGCRCAVLPCPAWAAFLAIKVMGVWQRDIMLTWQEVLGLTANKLFVPHAPTVGNRALSQWVHAHASQLGRNYSSELSRRAPVK